MATKHESYVILAAVEFDETGECALMESARHALLHDDCELHVVHVAADAKTSSDSLGLIGEELKKRVQMVELVRELKVTAHIRAGNTPRAILQTAADINADLLVVGTHKRVGVEKLVLGSVAERVLRDAHCPVLVAQPKDYLRAVQSDTVEPVCPDCLTARQAGANQRYWCERHSHSRLRMHLYAPSNSRRSSGPLEM